MKRTFRLTSGRRAVICRRVKLLKFGLKFLVDEQQSFHCANHVAARVLVLDRDFAVDELAVVYPILNAIFDPIPIVAEETDSFVRGRIR